MIFVTVGTTEFNELVEAADNLSGEVVIQKADGKYIPQKKDYFKYSDQFDDYLKKADVVITHGGAGTLFKLLEMGKKVVGVANEERSDLHQWDILKKLSDEGYLIWCQDISKLEECIKKAEKTDFKKYEKPNQEVARSIKSYLS